MRKWFFLLLLILCLSAGCALAEKTILLTFTGDCTIGSTELVRNRDTSFDTKAKEEGYRYFFINFRDLFAADDCTVINLESVLSDYASNENKNKTYRFRGPLSFTEIITSVSIEAAGLANNHVMDFGATGLKRTKDALEEAGVAWFRLDQYYIYEKDGIRVAMFAIDSGSYHNNSDKMRQIMRQLKQSGDVNAIVVLYHGGTEYDPKHNAGQTKVGQVMIDSGADLVIMHHPHVVQGIAYYKSRTICYSLGNFVFGGNSEIRVERWRGDHTVTSLYALVAQAELHFDDDGTYTGQQVWLYPVLTSGDAPHNNYQPFMVSGDDAKAVMEAVQFDTAFTLPEPDPETGRVTLPYLEAGAEPELPEATPTRKPSNPTRRPSTPKPKPTDSPSDDPNPPADDPNPPADDPNPPADDPNPPADNPNPPADNPPADNPNPPADNPNPPADNPNPPADNPNPPADNPENP